MKLSNAILISIAAALALTSGAAFAHGGHIHGRVGVFIGGPVYSPWWYYPPPYYYYPPAPVVVSPPTYIEKGADEPAPPSDRSYWYYCADSKAYYPYVKDCPGGWQRVTPQPPS